MARAFVTLGCLFKDVPANPRAWLFRVASNLWIDRQRRIRESALEDIELPEAVAESALRADAAAAGTLLVRLAPQERTAVVLKDVVDFTLDEIATMLSTTTGAIKAALHRGHGKLKVDAAPRVEPRWHRNEPVLLFWYAHADGEAVRAVASLQVDGDRVGRLRNYFFSSDVIAEVCAELGVPCRVNGY